MGSDMKTRRTWHDRPVIAPLVYGVSTVAIGGVGYASGFLATDSVIHAIYASLFIEALLVLYLRASHKEARRKSA
jgi:hypothetical protein